MNEIEILKSMWTMTTKRTEKLIVDLTYNEEEGSLNNDSWDFNVPYAFREALDIKYEQRMNKKNPYWVWTQGPLLNFRKGDTINSRDGSRAVQIESASPMEWRMYQGSVVFSEYSVVDGRFAKLKEHSCSQMQFLQMLIQGNYNG